MQQKTSFTFHSGCRAGIMRSISSWPCFEQNHERWKAYLARVKFIICLALALLLYTDYNESCLRCASRFNIHWEEWVSVCERMYCGEAQGDCAAWCVCTIMSFWLAAAQFLQLCCLCVYMYVWGIRERTHTHWRTHTHQTIPGMTERLTKTRISHVIVELFPRHPKYWRFRERIDAVKQRFSLFKPRFTRCCAGCTAVLICDKRCSPIRTFSNNSHLSTNFKLF